MGEPPLRIVLVEDNDIYRSTLELVLGMHDDLEVVGTARDGVAATRTCEELDPDVVLMDFRLPGIDGAQATRAIRDVRPHVAVVLVTAEASAQDRDAARRAGAAAIVDKGAPLVSLVEAVRSAGGVARAAH